MTDAATPEQYHGGAGNLVILVLSGIIGLIAAGQFSASLAVAGFFFGVSGGAVLIGRIQPVNTPAHSTGES